MPARFYEIGYARGIGRPVFGYTTVAAGYTERVLALLGPDVAPDATRDAEDLLVERFGLHDNLMIDAGIATGGGILLAADLPAAARWSDLSLFTRCIELTARHLLR